MKGQHDTGKADEFAAEAHELLSQRDGQDTADYAAAVAAAIKAASARPGTAGNPPVLDRPPGTAQAPAAGHRPAARTLAPRSPVARWPDFRLP